MSLPANTAWFTLTLNGRTDFSVFSFSGEEAVSTPYEFTVELLHPSDSENPTSFIGAPALLRVRDRSGQARPVHGLVREMKYLRRGNHLAHYQCVIVPRLWFLGQTRNHRIFQHQSAPEIIRRILEEQNFTADSFAFKCFHDYPEREYCVQYSESDLHFISRLCEEEGIYYYFEHTENGHCLCFSALSVLFRHAGRSAHRRGSRASLFSRFRTARRYRRRLPRDNSLPKRQRQGDPARLELSHPVRHSGIFRL